MIRTNSCLQQDLAKQLMISVCWETAHNMLHRRRIITPHRYKAPTGSYKMSYPLLLKKRITVSGYLEKVNGEDICSIFEEQFAPDGKADLLENF